MAPGTPALTPAILGGAGQRVISVSNATPFFTAIVSGIGGPQSQDAATITDPDNEIAVAKKIFKFPTNQGGGALYVGARLKYDDGISAPTSPIVKLFGRYHEQEPWMVLPSVGGNLSEELTIALTSDLTDGTYKRTVMERDTHLWDTLGRNEFVFGVETAFAATGTVNNSTLEACWL